MNLQDFFKNNPKVALGFSGGVDSSYLLYAAKQLGADIQPFFVKTEFQPDFELHDALRAVKYCDATLQIINIGVLEEKIITRNSSIRCYHCKNLIFNTIKRTALNMGYTLLIDGSNASDDAGDRPGMKALDEIGVISPLRDCGLTKSDIRQLSKEAGLFTWNKPSYACLATRFPAGTEITQDLLSKVEKSEDTLFKMGFTDFRVRIIDGAARIQIPEPQMKELLAKRNEILDELDYFPAIMLDLKSR